MDKPNIVQKKPYVESVKPGKYAWCSCGLSKSDPFCDGSHKGTDFKPVIVQIEEEKKVAWCGCKHSKDPVFCDGIHKQL
ncbi:MAG: CDGSH iron-sulfur domain-containing protein [Melioribacteraceae bacterium]